jgi:hypothetical protein
MPTNVIRLQREQLADVGRGAERVAEGLGVDVDWCGGDEFAIDFCEQERALGQRPAIECRQAFERGLVTKPTAADQEAINELELGWP